MIGKGLLLYGQEGGSDDDGGGLQRVYRAVLTEGRPSRLAGRSLRVNDDVVAGVDLVASPRGINPQASLTSLLALERGKGNDLSFSGDLAQWSQLITSALMDRTLFRQSAKVSGHLVYSPGLENEVSLGYPHGSNDWFILGS